MTTPDPNSKYTHLITGMDGTVTTVDVYRVQVAFAITDPEIAHAHKKLSMPGGRGKATKRQDILEAKLSLEKWLIRDGQENNISEKTPESEASVLGKNQARMDEIAFRPLLYRPIRTRGNCEGCYWKDRGNPGCITGKADCATHIYAEFL